MPYNFAAIRELVDTAFGDEELSTFCFDHFPSVYEQFTVGQTKGARVRMLVKHAQRQGLLDELLGWVREANPRRYSEFEPRLRTVLPRRPPSTRRSAALALALLLLAGGIGYVALRSIISRFASPTPAATRVVRAPTGTLTPTAIAPVAATVIPTHVLPIHTRTATPIQMPSATAPVAMPTLTQVLSTPTRTATYGPTVVAVSGRLLFSRYPQGEPSRMELCVWQTGEVGCLPVGGAGADWSSDGQWIAFCAGGSGQARIYRVTSDGEEPEDLTGEDMRNARNPAWSPDGQLLAFVALPEGSGKTSGAEDVFVMNSGGQIRLITTNPQADMMPDWSPNADQLQLVFVSWYEGRQGIYTVDVDAVDPEATRRLLWAVELGAVVDFPVWSPTGESIAFLYRPEMKAQLCLMAVPEYDYGEPTCHQVGAEALGLAWSPDGKMLAYIAIREEQWGIELLDVSSGESWLLTDQAGYELPAGLSWAP